MVRCFPLYLYRGAIFTDGWADVERGEDERAKDKQRRLREMAAGTYSKRGVEGGGAVGVCLDRIG